MQSFFVDLHLFLATWAGTLEPYTVIFLVLYLFVPILYSLIRRQSQHSSKFPSRFSLPFDREHREIYEERDERSYEHLVKNIAFYFTYMAVAGIIIGFILQTGTESVSALALIPIFSFGAAFLLLMQLIIQRERVEIIRKKRARLHGPEITDPEELKEVETLQRFVDALERKQAQENKL